jgi:hypothetical protein
MKEGNRVKIISKNSIYKDRTYVIKHADKTSEVYHLEFPNGDQVPFYSYEIVRCDLEVLDSYKKKLMEIL